MKIRNSKSQISYLKSVIFGYFRRLHEDTRGAIAVLVLLTLWCLLAIVGLVWNTMETATRRERIQTAADSAAHAAATWLARTHNAVTAQNMIISQDASAETIWRAITPTDTAITQRLEQEIAQAEQMKGQQGLPTLQRRMQNLLLEIATEYTLTNRALAAVEAGNGANHANTTDRTNFNHTARGARSAMEWVNSTYVNGAPPAMGHPSAPPRPGPPGPNGEGLAQIVTAWQPTANENAILDYIINFINTQEMPIERAFRARTAPAVAMPVDSLMAQHRAEVFTSEMAMVEALPIVVEAQRQQLADFYKTDITLATLKNDSSSAGPAAVTAPLIPAAAVPGYPVHVDSIRMNFFQEALNANLLPVVSIDPISPHTGDARIWHPDLVATIPAGYPNAGASYPVTANFPNGWGHNYATPLEQYVHQRIAGDLRELNDAYMVPLDDARSITLAQTIRQMMGLPAGNNLNITPLPGTLPDSQPAPYIPPATLPGQPPPPPPPPTFDQVPVLPRLSAPLNATSAFRTQVDLYNQHGAAYTGAVRNLRSTLISYTAYFERFIRRFAGETWHTQVNIAALTVLQNLGTSKQFMVLSTYGLRFIPDWAKPGMFISARDTFENQIVQISMQPIADAIARDLARTDPDGIGGAYLDSAYRETVLYAHYLQQATAIAEAIVRPIAHEIATNIANEWINRPWPFEIEPPQMPVPPFRGILPADRKLHWTILAGSRETPESSPQLIQLRWSDQDIFSTQPVKLVAYAQAEAFNWMEFNPSYGGGERFDQVVRIPEITYGTRNTSFNGFVGSPRGWRVNSIGGWNWRSRLSLSDALYPAVELNSELRAFLNDAGITTFTESALNEVNLH